MSEPKAIATDCEKAAKFYEEKPGMAGALTDVDLYRAIARLARIVEAQQKTLDHLIPSRDPLD